MDPPPALSPASLETASSLPSRPTLRPILGATPSAVDASQRVRSRIKNERRCPLTCVTELGTGGEARSQALFLEQEDPTRRVDGEQVLVLLAIPCRCLGHGLPYSTAGLVHLFPRAGRGRARRLHWGIHWTRASSQPRRHCTGSHGGSMKVPPAQNGSNPVCSAGHCCRRASLCPHGNPRHSLAPQA